MTDREKLIALYNRLEDEGLACIAGKADMADLMIANGVTVQTWIPATERLPEDGETVLVYGSRGGVYTAYHGRAWHKLNSKIHYCNPTHWMPLPKPPKEE